MSSVLVIESQPNARALIEGRFGGRISIDSSETLKGALARDERFDVIVWDANTAAPRCAREINALERFSKRSPAGKVIVIAQTNHGGLIDRCKLNCQWLEQPIDEMCLLASIDSALTGNVSPETFPSNGAEVLVPVEFEGILAFNLTMRTVIQHIIEAAAADIPVLISGETGTGKDLVAAAIHKRSARKNFRYVAVNMGAIAADLVASELFGHERGAYTGASDARAGFFEQAHGGTIFLDEITTMDAKTQVSLLRVLENKTIRRIRGQKDVPINVRVIAATNDDIEQAVKSGRFREDLYYRLDVFRIHLPPLRERHGAISLLTDHFVALYAEMYRKDIKTVARECYQLIRQYPWPGNIRQLKNVIQRAVLLAKGVELTPHLLPNRIANAASSATNSHKQSSFHIGMSLAEVEREYIKMTLASVSGNKMQAAAVLGISRRTLYNKLKRFGML